MFKKTLAVATLLLSSMTANAGVIESILPTDLDGVNDDSGFLMVLDYGDWTDGFWNENIFGLYLFDTADNTIKSSMNVFGGSDWIGSQSNVAWDLGAQKATSSATGDMLSWAGIESTWRLGAFFNDGDTSFFSHDVLNAGNADLVDIFELSPNSIFDLGFAWNQSTGNAGWQHEGMLVKATDMIAFDGVGTLCDNCVTQVSEPGTYGIMAAGLFGMFMLRRRKEKSNINMQALPA